MQTHYFAPWYKSFHHFDINGSFKFILPKCSWKNYNMSILTNEYWKNLFLKPFSCFLPELREGGRAIELE